MLVAAGEWQGIGIGIGYDDREGTERAGKEGRGVWSGVRVVDALGPVGC